MRRTKNKHFLFVKTKNIFALIIIIGWYVNYIYFITPMFCSVLFLTLQKENREIQFIIRMQYDPSWNTNSNKTKIHHFIKYNSFCKMHYILLTRSQMHYILSSSMSPPDSIRINWDPCDFPIPISLTKKKWVLRQHNLTLAS